MLVKKLKKELQKYNPNAKVKMHYKEGEDVVYITDNSNCGVVVLKNQHDIDSIFKKDATQLTLGKSSELFLSTLLVKELLEQLANYDDNVEVKMHHIDGYNLLFVVAYTDCDDIVVLEDASDNDLSSELYERFKTANERWPNELAFYKDLVETGFTLNDIRMYCPDKYVYSKRFMLEHNLLFPLLHQSTREHDLAAHTLDKTEGAPKSGKDIHKSNKTVSFMNLF